MALRVPVIEMHHVRTTVGAGAIKLRCLFRRSQPEGLLPSFLSVELVCVSVSVRGLVPHQAHEPLRRFAFHFENDFFLKPPQPFMHEKKWNEDGGNSHRHEPLVANVARRMKREALLRKLVVKLLDERLEFAALKLQRELRNL